MSLSYEHYHFYLRKKYCFVMSYLRNWSVFGENNMSHVPAFELYPQEVVSVQCTVNE